MLSVNSRSDLQRLAIKKGGTAIMPDGKRFNSAKATAIAASAPKPVAPEVAAPVPPVPREPDHSAELMAVLIQQNHTLAAQQDRISSLIAGALEQAASQASTPSEPASQWNFEFVRDTNYRLVRVIARKVAP